MADKKYLSKEQLALINPYGYQHHYMTTADWINQCFEIQQDNDGRPIIVPGHQIFNENGNIVQQYKYKIKRKAELWMIALVVIMDLEFATRALSVINKKKVKEFAFYGSYNRIREKILDAVDSKLVPQLSRSITIRSISTSMKRAEASGFIKIEYDQTITRKTCSIDKNYRRITINYDKLMELSEFNLDKKKRSNTWKKYHSSSREHKWLKKRPVSYLKPLINELADKNKKEAFREKLKALKLKLKNHQDIFKAFIINMQKMYKTSPLKNLTTIKSMEEQATEEIKIMYQKHDTDEIVLSPEQQAILQGFYASIV